MNARLLSVLLVFLVLPAPILRSQISRPGNGAAEPGLRVKSNLPKEEGAIYLEEMVEGEVAVRIATAAPVYTNLQGARWLGNLLPSQNAVLLAVSERAYRVRAQAKQGQVAGWVAKAAVTGLPPDFEENLKLFHERYLIVSDLIAHKQIALGMTVAEVTAAIGAPNQRQSTVDGEGRRDLLEYVTYERVPQTFTTVDPLGRPVSATRYVEVEVGRISVTFADDAVVSISESEGFNYRNARLDLFVPPPVVLF